MQARRAVRRPPDRRRSAALGSGREICWRAVAWRDSCPASAAERQCTYISEHFGRYQSLLEDIVALSRSSVMSQELPEISSFIVALSQGSVAFAFQVLDSK